METYGFDPNSFQNHWKLLGLVLKGYAIIANLWVLRQRCPKPLEISGIYFRCVRNLLKHLGLIPKCPKSSKTSGIQHKSLQNHQKSLGLELKASEIIRRLQYHQKHLGLILTLSDTIETSDLTLMSVRKHWKSLGLTLKVSKTLKPLF